ncbi:MAG: hypothetical protein ACRCS9_16560 [Hyphomicrobium sp.]
MWPVSGTSRPLILSMAIVSLLASVHSASAQTTAQQYPYYLNNQTYSYGMHLPQVPQPNGQDEIRAADGTTCRSSMASNGAYADLGGLAGQDNGGAFNSGTVYARMIIPLGGVPNRLDCSELYNLEIRRLQHELELARAGANTPMASVAPTQETVKVAKANTKPSGKSWADDGWSNSGWKGASKPSDVKASLQTTSAPNGPKTKTNTQQPPPQHLGAAMPSARATDNSPEISATAISTTEISAGAAEVLPWQSEPAARQRVITTVSSIAPGMRTKTRAQQRTEEERPFPY